MFKHRCSCMKIEEAIKQTKPFESEFQKVGVNLLYTSNWVGMKMQKFFKSFNLTQKQFNIMRILKGAGKPVSTSFIRERLLDRMSDVSRIVDRMESKSIVKKSSCETDKRLVDVELTCEGSQLLDYVNKELKILDKMFARLTLQEIETLNKLLDKIRSI